MNNNSQAPPISLLYDELIANFASKNGTGNNVILSLLKKGKPLSIRIDPSETRLVTPKVDLKTGWIRLHQSHLSYIWCIIFSFISLLNFAGKRMSKGKTFIMMTDAPELRETDALISWAISLNREYSVWPSMLPSPANTSQKCTLVNRIFIKTVLYMMYHELAHLSNGHDQYISLILKKELDEDEKLILKQLEVEADNFAFECLADTADTEKIMLVNIFAASIAHISNLYLISNISELIQMRHPDIDTRIFNLMNKVQFENKHYRSGLDLIYNIALSLFINRLPTNYITEDMKFESFEDILSYLYSCLDKEKSNIIFRSKLN